MEILTCPDDKIYDKSLKACINEKAISFDSDKSRCEKRKPNVSSAANHNCICQLFILYLMNEYNSYEDIIFIYFVINPAKTPQPGRSVTKTPTKFAFSSSESTPTVKPILKNDPNPFDNPPKSEATFTQQPNFVTPFNNFPPTEKSSSRILFHEPFVKPYSKIEVFGPNGNNK